MKKKLWLISKHGNDVGDNAFALFKYVREKHPEIRSVYVADKEQYKAYKTAKEVGPIVQYRSFMHKILYFLADKIVTSHVGDSEPWEYENILELRRRFPGWSVRQKTIHLQHGVIDKNVAHIYDISKRPVDLFICSTLAEKDYIMETLHYPSERLACTGLARFDALMDAKCEKKILVIPRYRRDVMVQLRENKQKLKYHFMKSRYYKNYQTLISNQTLVRKLEESGWQLIFYPHYEVQPLISCFHAESKNVTVADMEREELDQLLKECALLITDYSSVAFDFAYMRRPVIYYQFDKEEFDCEYGGSYFDHERDGFGPVVEREDDVVRCIESFIDGRFDRDHQYYDRCVNTFLYHDDQNCKRIFEAIEEV